MVHYKDISAQKVSWVKSDKDRLEGESRIRNLFYPETIDEFVYLLKSLIAEGAEFDVIGFSSNTLFLPSYSIDNLICTTKLNKWRESDDSIVCECGVPVASLAKAMIENGFVGFEGLTDLPGTIAAGVYGNAGCRGCSVNALVKSIEVMDYDGKIREMTVDDLALRYRSTSLKRGEMKAVILLVRLNKVDGDASELVAKADMNHRFRLAHQPSGANNLGTTYLPGNSLTLKGKMFRRLHRVINRLSSQHDPISSYKMTLKWTGNGRFVPYLFDWNRYMFLDQHSHELFSGYTEFLKSLDPGVTLEIEIRS